MVFKFGSFLCHSHTSHYKWPYQIPSCGSTVRLSYFQACSSSHWTPPPPPATEVLKATLLDEYEATQFQKDTAVLNMHGLGDRRPSGLLQYMRSHNSEPQTLFRALFLNQLPPEVPCMLAQTPDVDLDTLTKTANRILQSVFAGTSFCGSDLSTILPYSQG